MHRISTFQHTHPNNSRSLSCHKAIRGSWDAPRSGVRGPFVRIPPSVFVPLPDGMTVQHQKRRYAHENRRLYSSMCCGRNAAHRRGYELSSTRQSSGLDERLTTLREWPCEWDCPLSAGYEPRTLTKSARVLSVLIARLTGPSYTDPSKSMWK